jgi:hypothetical protein
MMGSRGLRQVAACSLAGVALILLQLGGGATPTSRAIDQINARSSRPLRSLPPAPPASGSPVWVPDRIAPSPLAPLGVLVPGHWEQPYGPGRYIVPPLVVCDQASGVCGTVPGGVQGPVEQRPLPTDPALLRGGSTVTSP